VLVRSWGATAGIGSCALLLSGTNLALLGLPPQTLLLNVLVSVAFGIVRHKTGSTMVVAISHAAYNATFFFGALLLELLAG
jgi:membrane protease YdiL (CAAX protease family)